MLKVYEVKFYHLRPSEMQTSLYGRDSTKTTRRKLFSRIYWLDPICSLTVPLYLNGLLASFSLVGAQLSCHIAAIAIYPGLDFSSHQQVLPLTHRFSYGDLACLLFFHSPEPD